jgi:hypothetical protein
MALIFLTEKLNGVKLRKGVTMSKIEIRQVEGEKIFTEICIDGHKIDGVRGYELKQDKAGFPVLTIDLNAFDIATDLRALQLNQKYVGTIESIKFRDGYEVNFGSRVSESQ